MSKIIKKGVFFILVFATILSLTSCKDQSLHEPMVEVDVHPIVVDAPSTSVDQIPETVEGIFLDDVTMWGYSQVKSTNNFILSTTNGKMENNILSFDATFKNTGDMPIEVELSYIPYVKDRYKVFGKESVSLKSEEEIVKTVKIEVDDSCIKKVCANGVIKDQNGNELKQIMLTEIVGVR